MAVDQTSYDAPDCGGAAKVSKVLTTIADGSVTGYLGPFTGKLNSLAYIKIDFADGVDFTITKESTGENIWVDTNINATEVVRPRVITQNPADGAANTTLVMREPLLFVNERIKIVIGSGGNVKTGRFTALVD
jgi:hypothetical protein